MATIEAMAGKLYLDLTEKLQAEKTKHTSIVTATEAAALICQDYLSQLKDLVKNYVFADAAEEIHFFKCIKPDFYSELIYYVSIYRVHTQWPAGSESDQKAYLRSELANINFFFESNEPFYHYYRTNSTHLDERYFMRGKYDPKPNAEIFYFDIDPSFCSLFDAKVARIMANDRLQKDLIAYLDRLDALDTLNPAQPLYGLTWTDSKTALVELLYALQALGAFNNRKADLKDIALCFETAFNIQLPDYYKTWAEIRMRKSAKAKFLDALKDVLVRRIDEAD
jgi:hypothetical protein